MTLSQKENVGEVTNESKEECLPPFSCYAETEWKKKVPYTMVTEYGGKAAHPIASQPCTSRLVISYESHHTWCGCFLGNCAAHSLLRLLTCISSIRTWLLPQGRACTLVARHCTCITWHLVFELPTCAWKLERRTCGFDHCVESCSACLW